MPITELKPIKIMLSVFKSRIFTAILLILSSIGLGIYSLYFAAAIEQQKMFEGYLADFWTAVLNIVPCVWLALTLWFITGYSAISFGLTSVIVMGFTLASWFKIEFRNDPLMFEDLSLIKEATNMSEKYAIALTDEMKTAIWTLVAVTVLLALIARGKFKLRGRMIGIISMIICSTALVGFYTDETLYNRKLQNGELVNEWSDTDNYITHGFVYPFLYSIKQAIVVPPEGYNEEETKNLLESYESQDIPNDEKVDVIAIMLEAYADFSVYDQIEFDTDPYELYHELEKESISGNLLTNIFAGGTVDSERAFLTGYSHQESFRTPTNSYVRYFAEQGYTVTGSHPSYDWFYNRRNINENLGFDSYYFMENHYNELTDDEVAMDRILIPEIQRLYDEHKENSENNEPYFSFNVTYQGHGPYGEEENFYSREFVKDGVYTEKTQNILNNYFGSIAETNGYLMDLIDSYRKSDDGVIIILFGDHKPWLGDGSSVYKELGIDLAYADSEEAFYNYYGTRYLIWANNAAKKALDADFEGEGPDIGPYFLMNVLFEECGWEGNSYMQAVDEIYKNLPVISTYDYYMQDGHITNKLTDKSNELLQRYLCLEYYEQNNFRQTEK